MLRFVTLIGLFFVVLIAFTHSFAKYRERNPRTSDAYLGLVVAALTVYFVAGIGAEGREAKEEAALTAQKVAHQERAAALSKEREPIDQCGGDGSDDPSNWRWRESDVQFSKARAERTKWKEWTIEFAKNQHAESSCLGDLRLGVAGDPYGKIPCPYKAPIWPQLRDQQAAVNRILGHLGLPPSGGLQIRSFVKALGGGRTYDRQYPLGLLTVQVGRQHVGGDSSDCWLVTGIAITKPWQPGEPMTWD